MKYKIAPLSQIVMVMCSVALVAVIFLPVWRIELSAPQYPEGLILQIFSYKLGGNVDIVNGLNHYIGMRTLHEEDFAEFKILPYIIGVYALLALLVAIIRRRWALFAWFILFVLFAVLAMVDFYRWEYDYGHNLDPSAPIMVPGMTYQPPLIGYKQLLNFGAYSIPDMGGWLLVIVGLLVFFLVIKEQKRFSRSERLRAGAMAALFGIVVSLAGCQSGPVPLRLGQDACDFCKMTISHPNYGAELITKKGKIYRFDDLTCLFAFVPTGVVAENAVRDYYIVDFSTGGELVKATEGYFLKSDKIRGPMGGDIAAFKHADSLAKFQDQLGGDVTKWQELFK